MYCHLYGRQPSRKYRTYSLREQDFNGWYQPARCRIQDILQCAYRHGSQSASLVEGHQREHLHANIGAPEEERQFQRMIHQVCSPALAKAIVEV